MNSVMVGPPSIKVASGSPAGMRSVSRAKVRSGGSAAAAASEAVVAPDSTRPLAMPAVRASPTSVSNRSPTMSASSAGTPIWRRMAAAMCRDGLPTIASARAPVHASSAASIAAQSGRPPSAVGQIRVGVGGHDARAVADGPEGRQQLVVVEAAVPRDDHHRRLVGPVGQPMTRLQQHLPHEWLRDQRGSGPAGGASRRYADERVERGDAPRPGAEMPNARQLRGIRVAPPQGVVGQERDPCARRAHPAGAPRPRHR